MANRYLSAEDRFWSRVEKTDGCWLWRGPSKHFGYGSLSLGGHTVAAHRFSWQLHNGPIPDGMNVCHHCDNPPCVRPEHLFLGTLIDNNRDRDAKHRFVSPRGERHGSARLTWAAVAEIRRSSLSSRVIARHYGVSSSSILRVRRYENWTVSMEGAAMTPFGQFLLFFAQLLLGLFVAAFLILELVRWVVVG